MQWSLTSSVSLTYSLLNNHSHKFGAATCFSITKNAFWVLHDIMDFRTYSLGYALLLRNSSAVDNRLGTASHIQVRYQASIVIRGIHWPRIGKTSWDDPTICYRRLSHAEIMTRSMAELGPGKGNMVFLYTLLKIQTYPKRLSFAFAMKCRTYSAARGPYQGKILVQSTIMLDMTSHTFGVYETQTTMLAESIITGVGIDYQ